VFTQIFTTAMIQQYRPKVGVAVYCDVMPHRSVA